MLFLVSSKYALEHNPECIAFVVEQDAPLPAALENLSSLFVDIRTYIKTRDFTGKSQTVFTLPAVHNGKVVQLVIVGLGKRTVDGIIDGEQYRRAVARVARTAESLRCAHIALHLPDDSVVGLSTKDVAKETTIAMRLAAYTFDEFVTDQEAKKKHVTQVFLLGKGEAELQAGVDEGTIIADAVNGARHWIDMPPRAMTPTILAHEAHEIARKYGLKATIFNEQEVTQMGMGGLAGVSRGSDEECRLAILEYHTAQPKAPTLCIVGKGITFDSGGISIKPAANMEAMKDDMSGAAAVISTMRALAQLKPHVNVIALAPMAENLPSGKATKPGDIVTFYNGKTAEVKNTDAEGRLILADALSYAVKHYKPDVIIDIATLTGACSHALGPFFSGLMSQHEDLAQRIIAAGKRTGDRVWPLPLDNDYKAAVKSHVADLCNIGSGKYRAGAITAAFFLQSFVGDTKWAHLDIAGTALDIPDLPFYRPEGATGAGVRLFIDLIMRWGK